MSETTRPKAVLVGVLLPRVTEQDNEASLQELGRLVDTLGFDVVGSLSQKRSGLSGGTVIGEGKLAELARWTGGTGKVASAVKKKKSKAAERFSKEAEDEEDVVENDVDSELEEESVESEGGPPSDVKADVVVFDTELTPSQLRNLESAVGVEVLDRTGVIIEIFSRHAKTRAAQLQVEIARLNYLAPRLRETGGGGDRQGGGIGGKGAGESSQELDRRRIRDRVKELREDLEAVHSETKVRRARRSTENCVALVGYTNAGKSSLMRAMTGSEVYVADKLFATLDTTVRPLYPDSVPRVLLTDTVGFIKKLPHDLVASFHSTLDEALNADLLYYVVDSSDPTFRAQLEVTRAVLKEIGADTVPSRLILNKSDRLSADERRALMAEFPDALMISTRDKTDLLRVRDAMLAHFEKDMVDEDILVPYSVQGVIGEIRSQTRVLSESYDEKGAKFRLRATPETLARLRRKVPPPF